MGRVLCEQKMTFFGLARSVLFLSVRVWIKVFHYLTRGGSHFLCTVPIDLDHFLSPYCLF